MTRGSILDVAIALITAVAVAFAAYQASVVFAPLTLGLFIIALIWPMKDALQRRIPAFAAIFVTMAVTVAVVLTFASLLAWGFGHVGRSVIADSGRYQATLDATVAWLESHAVSVAGLWAEHFNVGWMMRSAHQITERLSTTLSFWLATLLYVVLGLMEIDDLRPKVAAYLEPGSARALLLATGDVAHKFRRHMVARTQMSLATGALVAAFAWAVGLRLAAEWGGYRLHPELHSVPGTLHRDALSDLVRDGPVCDMGGGPWRTHLSQHHSIRFRQLYRAARIGQRFSDVADGGDVCHLLLDLSLGHLRNLHRRTNHNCRIDVLQALSVNPMDCRSRGRAGL